MLLLFIFIVLKQYFPGARRRWLQLTLYHLFKVLKPSNKALSNCCRLLYPLMSINIRTYYARRLIMLILPMHFKSKFPLLLLTTLQLQHQLINLLLAYLLGSGELHHYLPYFLLMLLSYLLHLLYMAVLLG